MKKKINTPEEKHDCSEDLYGNCYTCGKDMTISKLSVVDRFKKRMKQKRLDSFNKGVVNTEILRPEKITIKNCKVVKTKGHDYTLEIKRCISDIFFHLKRGDALNDAIAKAQGSYGYMITLNARRAIYRWANK